MSKKPYSRWRRALYYVMSGLVAAGCTLAEPQVPVPTTGAAEATPALTVATTPVPAPEPTGEAAAENAMPPNHESDARYAVYAAVINELYEPAVNAAGEAIQVVLLAEPEDALSAAGTVEQLQSYLRQNFGDALDEETLADFVAKQAERTPLAHHDALPFAHEVISRADLEGLVSESGEWQLFFEMYPQASGVISFSPVGFDAAGEQALVLTGFAGDFGSGQGTYVLLTRQAGAWVVDQSALAWVN